MNPQLGGELDDLDFQSFNLKRADGYAIEFHYWYDDKPARVRCRHSVMSERMSHLNSQPFRRPRGNTGDSGSRIHQQLNTENTIENCIDNQDSTIGSAGGDSIGASGHSCM